MILVRRAVLLCLACLPLLAACEGPSTGQASTAASSPANHPPASSASTAHDAALARKAASVAGEVRDRMSRQNVGLSDDRNLPKAEITPHGDLLIAGEAVEVDARQRALLLQYRGQIIDIASAGSAIGVYGADVGIKAAGEAVAGILTGNTDDIEKTVERKAGALKTEALKLCDRLPAMRATQDALAASLPAFRPYARMDGSDVDDCRDDGR